jgi:hypothetical protein
MKKIFFFALILSSFLFAQSPLDGSSSQASTADSVKIREMIKEQIEKAKEKHFTMLNSSQTYQEERIEVPTVTEPAVETTAQAKNATIIDNASMNSTVQRGIIYYFNSIPLHYKIFIAAALSILLMIVLRRALIAVSRRAKKSLREKIAMLREERVISKENKKLKNSRQQLKNSKTIFEASERQISKAAKELDLAKGELLLAARLKLFEVGKI